MDPLKAGVYSASSSGNSSGSADGVLRVFEPGRRRAPAPPAKEGAHPRGERLDVVLAERARSLTGGRLGMRSDVPHKSDRDPCICRSSVIVISASPARSPAGWHGRRPSRRRPRYPFTSMYSRSSLSPTARPSAADPRPALDKRVPLDGRRVMGLLEPDVPPDLRGL